MQREEVTSGGSSGASVGPDDFRVAYVVSMRQGLHSFVYRELEELERRGVRFVLLAISRGPKGYRPKAQWRVVTPRPSSVVVSLAKSLFKAPRALVRLVGHSVRNGSLVDLFLAISFVPAVRRSRSRSIHSHFGDHKLFVGYYVSELTHLPLTVTVHAYELYSNPNPAMFRQALARCRFVITVSDYNKAVLEAQYAVPEEKTRVIRLFPWEVEDVADPGKAGLFTVLCVARFTAKKGHDVLFGALRRVLDLGHTDIRLVLVGKGPLDVSGTVRNMGLDPYVSIVADLEETELRKLYRSASVFCLPSRVSPEGDREGIPVSVMEAMAYGLPVVTTVHAGIPELVRETLVPENDPEALARAIVYLKSNPDIRRRQGESNRRVIRQDYSSRNVGELVELFRRAQGEVS